MFIGTAFWHFNSLDTVCHYPSEESDVIGNTYGHGIVEGVVVDAGSQWVIQHAILKQLQWFCHFFMKIFCRFISTCKVQIIRVQSVDEIRASKWQRKWKKIYLHDNGNHLHELRAVARVCNIAPAALFSHDTFSIQFDGLWLRMTATPWSCSKSSPLARSVSCEILDLSNCMSQYFLIKANFLNVHTLNLCYL